MMKNDTSAFVFIMSVLIAVLLNSCIPKPLQIELPEMESAPVVWCQIVPNNVTLIYMAKTFSALEFQEGDSTSTSDLVQQFLVQDGFVTLTHNNVTDTLIQVTDGFFASFDTELIAGDTYYLFAKDQLSGKEVSAQTTMMQKLFLDTAYVNVIDTNTVDVRYSFTDPAGPNWYAVHFYSSYSDPLALDDPFAAENVVETQLISDIEFASGQIEKSIELDFIDSDTIYVSFNNVSEEYYDYLAQRQRGGNIYNQLVQEPINYYSNVTNGYGMFSMHFPDLHTIELPE